MKINIVKKVYLSIDLVGLKDYILESSHTKEKKMKDEISKALKYDALAEAEKITNANYKDHTGTVEIGMALHSVHNMHKNRLLEQTDDTKIMNETENYLRITRDLGFKEVLCETSDAEEGTDKNYILWHERFGILLHFDTYGEHVNGGNFYYNWIPSQGLEDYSGITSSGGFKKNGDLLIWSGNHDCREALRFYISQLSDNGTFLNRWVDTPFLWLLSHMDSKQDGYDHKKINKEYISKLPKDVISAITPKGD